VTSPTLAAQLQELHRRFPEAKWHQYEPISRDYVRAGSRLAFGEPVESQYRFDSAKVIVSLDADFLYLHPDRLKYTRHFINGRPISSGKSEMNRLYVVESSPTVTGSVADHRFILASGKVESFAVELAKQLGVALDIQAEASGVPATLVKDLATDLQQHKGACVIVAGECQPPVVHALAHLLNEQLGNSGKTVFYTEPVEANPSYEMQSLRELTQDMRAGHVDALFILGGNPVYTAPADLAFAELLSSVKQSVHLGLELDETAVRCTWHIPATHYLESWGDARSFDGTISLIQPLISPLYNGKSAYEIVGAMLRQQPSPTDYEAVRNYWQSQNKWPDFEAHWREALHNGFIQGTAAPPKQVRAPDPSRITAAIAESINKRAHPGVATHAPANTSQLASRSNVAGLEFVPNKITTDISSQPAETDLEICFRPDASVWDGRFANNGWLQECPRPISKLTWDNAALISPALAQRCGLASGDVVELRVGDRQLRAPVWIMPGQADKTITLHLGYGRSRTGRVGAGVGVNTYVLRTTENPWIAPGAQLYKTSEHRLLVSTQAHHSVDNADRQVLRECELQQFVAQPQLVKHSVEQPEPEETLYDTKEYDYPGYKWGMSIDLTACLGCNACLLACEAENNIPFVGKDQVNRHREMFWIRVDTYYKGSLDNPGFAHMPVPCMHCEHAPCELVCPVEATVHDREGLNLQVYNRCVGTRFCSNNCPYKVRRFNFYQYTQYHQPSYEPMYNPEVTVRWRGVMEKCTYCIQRISAARITAEKENRRIGDRELKTACQQSCPANAIVFGNLNSASSEVAQRKNHPLDYSMLGQLNTRPRTTYLAKVLNPNSKRAA
ncbi:MAG TPA: 4Fe-4S dicluster domain-containing protein, partial [Patescibacteria group bacterium]|nr:4Fe-4S dicluster domain-containing protein [Patescibacteria group bacterium]